jgi:hypothetical protein
VLRGQKGGKVGYLASENRESSFMDTHEGIVETTVTVHHGVCMDPNDEIVAIA